MSIIYVLLPIALFLGFGFLALFIRMSADGQYEDLETPAYRILIDDEKITSENQLEKGSIHVS
ncbi:MAG: cbb3-type cytochrome oxidase assembly protein CcoS [Methylotenera sp.]|nr:cbb3-type cytochrome oxidase assembly protein CcoS [Oligoflexia bacterium]